MDRFVGSWKGIIYLLKIITCTLRTMHIYILLLFYSEYYYCLYSSVLPLNIQYSRRSDSIDHIYSPYSYSCPRPWHWCPLGNVMGFFVFKDFKWEILVCIVNLVESLTNHCLNFLSYQCILRSKPLALNTYNPTKCLKYLCTYFN
jgi:hypothetical protein